RRSRVITSCHACRTDRTKCDRIHPVCGRCARRGGTCHWAGSALKSASATKTSHHQQPHQRDFGVAHSQPLDEDIRPGYLALQGGGRSRYVHNNFWANVGHKGVELDELLSTVSIFPFPNCCCSLAPSEQFCAPAAADSQNVGNASSQDVKIPSPEPGIRCNRKYSLSQLLDALPPQEICNELYQKFLDNIHPITPLLHIPTFQSQYIRFWHWFQSWDRRKIPNGLLAETPSFLPLLFAVLFAGSIAASTDIPGEDPEVRSFSAISTSLYRSHSQALSLVSFPQSPTIYSLIAYLIAQNLLIREESLSSCSFLSVALRIAQAMGLNRDGTYFKLDLIQAEIRRRVWWHIIHTDIMTCFPSGLPPLMVIDDQYDTQMISELKDEYIGGPADGTINQEEMQHSTQVDIRYVVAVGRYRITNLMRKILRRQFSVLPMSGKDIMTLKEAVDEQSTETGMRIEQIAAMKLNSGGPSRHDQRNNASSSILGRCPDTSIAKVFQTWSQKLLRLLTHKSYCMLYQPLLKGVYGGLNSRLRKDALCHCHAYVETFLDMSTGPEFHPFYWLYPGTYQPLQATAILLDDVLKSPFSEEAQHSRMLVEKLFSLVGPHGIGLSNGRNSNRDLSPAGKEVWEMLRRLRRRAWKKAGIDPDMAWLDD
ncbi:hypothetical protein OIDMADRAFT_97648, partial [Oidiodendron maius Zn]